MNSTRERKDMNLADSIDIPIAVPAVTRTCDMQYYLKQVNKGQQASGGKTNLVRRFYRNGGKPRGFHDFHNLQWDPSIYRGRAFKDFREKNLSPYSKAVNFNNYCCSTALECKKRELTTLPRKPRKITFPKFKVGGIVRPTTDDIIDEETSGHKRHKQDEFRKEIEPFVVEQLVAPVYKEMGSQSDECKDPVPRACARVASGLCASTQADICSCWSGGDDDPSKAIIESVGSKVLQQSLLESTEEYELQRIRAELAKYVEKRRIRQAKQMKIVQDELFKAELELKEKVVRERELQQELAATAAIEAIMFVNVLCHKAMLQTFDHLRTQQFLEAAGTVAKTQLGPWLMNQISTDIFIPRHLLNEIIRKVESEKVEEYAEPTSTLYKNQNNGDFEGNNSSHLVTPFSAMPLTMAIDGLQMAAEE